MSSCPFREVQPTSDQKTKLAEAHIAFIVASPFYSHLFYSIGKEVISLDLPTAATDGRHIVINPEYMASLKVSERVFVLAHEMQHLVSRHCQRMKHYLHEGAVRTKPAAMELMNIAADYVINADLVETSVGSINPDWLFDPQISGSELWEDVYERKVIVQPPPPPPPPGQGNKPGNGPSGRGKPGNSAPQPGMGQPNNSTYGSSGKAPNGAKGDPVARGQGGSFDQLLEPPVDPETGAVDLPDANEFKEAVARAAGFAKAAGKLPASIQRLVDEILDPQVDWRDHIRMLMTGKIGSRGETWARPNRRRLALNPIVVMPGRRGYGAELVVVGVDTSGSIAERELNAFFAEVGGILQDVKPRRIVVIGCDADVSQVDEVTSLDEFEGLRRKGIKGGGGTSFIPVFDYIEQENLKPETVVYLTDGLGSAPSEPPPYPVVWAVTEGGRELPWGDHVWIKV
jgi:predicted metal-dependent peptidase